jgi:hypothetical protein
VIDGRQAYEALCSAVREYARADTDEKQALAVLSLQNGLDGALRAYLESFGLAYIDYRSVSYPDLVDLVRDRTALFAGDAELPRLLVSLNNTRNRIAHPEPSSRPTTDDISRDARQYIKLARRFWPSLFGEAFPTDLLAAPAEPEPRPEPVPPPRPEPLPAARLGPKPARWHGVRRVLRKLWSDESTPHLRKGLLLRRVIGIVIFLLLAKLLKDAAIFTARWPEPVKYGGLVLFLLAIALFAWGLILTWKALRQIRLEGVLLFLVVAYILLLGAAVLTSTSALPWFQVAWQASRDSIGLAGRTAVDSAGAILSAPQEFRVAYLGYRRPVRVPGIDTDAPSYLTPIPANRPATLAAEAEPTSRSGQPTPEGTAAPDKEESGSLPLPDCPHPQARLTAPRVGQVIQGQVEVSGTANIDGFDYYKFEYCRVLDPTETWHWIASFETPVDNGLLGTWDVSALPADLYILRLTVVNMEGNYPYPPCQVTVQIGGD